jgi:hypothetical protein
MIGPNSINSVAPMFEIKSKPQNTATTTG